MKFAVDLSKGVLGSADSTELWTEIVSHIPDSVLLTPNVRILSVACGHCTEAVIIAKRMLALGISKEAVRDSIWLIDKYNVFTNHAKLAYGFTNVITADFLEWETDMKFDVIVGNPPYLKGKWVEFLKQAAMLSKKHVLMVSPDGTNNFSTRSDNLVEFLKENGIQSKKECTASFPNVESGSIVIYELDVTQPFNQSAFIDNSMEGIITAKIIGARGNRLNAILASKRSKKWSNVPKFERSATGLIKNVESVTKEGEVLLWVDPNNTTVIDGNNYWLVNRYFGKDSDTSVIEVSEKVGISSNIMAIERLNSWSVEEFKEVYLSKLFRFVLNVLRRGGFDTSPRHIKQLIKVKKTGSDLYQHFNLTDEEIAYVEANVK